MSPAQLAADWFDTVSSDPTWWRRQADINAYDVVRQAYCLAEAERLEGGGP